MYESITIIIPTHKRNELITDLLKKLEKQDYPKSKYEILVVSDIETEEIHQPVASNVKIYRVNFTGADKKRNFGAKMASGSIIAFTDDDCKPENNWLKSINEAFKKNLNAVAVEGITNGKAERLFDHVINNTFGGNYTTSNMSFRKDEFDKIGGFDENYKYFREDSDIAFRLIRSGKKIIFDKSVKVLHPPIKRNRTSILKELFLVKNDIRLYKKYTNMYKKHFGFICRGMIKQASFTWLTLAGIIFSILFEIYNLIPLFILSILLFRYFVSLRGKKFNLFECLYLALLSYVRDLLFVFFFIYYWNKVRV
jgi:GT2 family glycosyltransferase